MVDKTKVFISFLLGAIVVMAIYIVIQSPKVKAWEEITQAVNTIEEYNKLILEEQEKFKVAMESSEECRTSWEQKASESHTKADKYREEIKKLEGLIKSRAAQK